MVLIPLCFPQLRFVQPALSPTLADIRPLASIRRPIRKALVFGATLFIRLR
jgi:hypothetical protein